jgi:LacI family transcriptional regulator
LISSVRDKGKLIVSTVYDVAKEAKVSIATVSRVFNRSNAVSEETQLRVRRAAEKLDYTPHLGARSLMIKRTDTVGIILPDMHGEFFSELVKGADAVARERGLHLLLSCSHDNAEDMAAALSSMRGRVDGIVVMSPLIGANAIQKYVPKDLPIVIVNGGRQDTHYSTVSLDNFTGAYKMTKHLIDEGRERISLISGPTDNQDAEERKRGYVRAMEELAANGQPDIIEGDFSETSGYQAGLQILSRALRPDAIFASNDSMAIGCLGALKDHGVSVPEDIALAGFDDIPLARYVRPSLSSVGAPIAKLGVKSLEVLVEKLQQDNEDQEPNEFLFAPSLIIRDSSKKPVTNRSHGSATEA